MHLLCFRRSHVISSCRVYGVWVTSTDEPTKENYYLRHEKCFTKKYAGGTGVKLLPKQVSFQRDLLLRLTYGMSIGTCSKPRGDLPQSVHLVWNPIPSRYVANSNGMVMGKGVMGLSTLLLSHSVVVVMPKKSRTSVWVLLCK